MSLLLPHHPKTNSINICAMGYNVPSLDPPPILHQLQWLYISTITIYIRNSVECLIYHYHIWEMEFNVLQIEFNARANEPCNKI